MSGFRRFFSIRLLTIEVVLAEIYGVKGSPLGNCDAIVMIFFDRENNWLNDLVIS
jgi:hypothetical protein